MNDVREFLSRSPCKKCTFTTAVIAIILLDYGVHTRILKIRLGLLQGITKEAASHQKYFHAYYAIPYAKPPIGNLRFEPPVKAEPWKGVLNATKLTASCPQIDYDSNFYDGEEDCLYLNVFTPLNVKAGTNLPVIFYIFGGQFRTEYPTRYGPEYLMSRDVVIVIANYRLGALGFLSTGDTVIAGNMALKDQLMAMKWTKQNIYDFGGDPRRVTLHGHSSGSTCVHLHTISPLSADYFDQAIMQSGFGTEPMMFWDGDVAKGISRAFAAQLNCTSFSSSSLKECFLNRTARELVLAAENISLTQSDLVGTTVPFVVFVPVIEDKNVEGAFLTENPPHTPYPSNGKPWLLGITENEGAGDATDNDLDFFENVGLKLSLSTVLGSIWYSKPNDVDFVVRWVKVRFFGEEEIRSTTEGADLAVSKIKSGPKGFSLLEAVRKYEGLKYVYRFDYRYVGGFYAAAEYLRNGRFLGASHADEMPIMFKINQTGVAEEDLAFGDEMITRWVNFAYSGNPNSPFTLNTSVFGAWDPVSSSRIEFLRIDRNGGMEKDYFEEVYGFWRRLPIFSKYSSN